MNSFESTEYRDNMSKKGYEQIENTILRKFAKIWVCGKSARNLYEIPQRTSTVTVSKQCSEIKCFNDKRKVYHATSFRFTLNNSPVYDDAR